MKNLAWNADHPSLETHPIGGLMARVGLSAIAALRFVCIYIHTTGRRVNKTCKIIHKNVEDR